MLHARRPRAVLAALALSALALASAPAASPAAPQQTPAKATATKPPAKAGASVKPVTNGKPGAKTVAAKPKPKPTAKPLFSYKDAPADEYFGRLKMSILGVRSKVKDLGLDADTHPEHDAAILSTALFVEDAMRDWSKKYPYDHWLPRYAFALEVMYEHIPGGEAAKRAHRQLNYITAFFPQTVYGKVGRAKLADGIPTPDPSATPATELERLALIDGKVRPTVPPAASALSSPDPNAAPAPTTTTVPATNTAPAFGAPLTAPGTSTAPAMIVAPPTDVPAPALGAPYAAPNASLTPASAPRATSAPGTATARPASP